MQRIARWIEAWWWRSSSPPPLALRLLSAVYGALWRLHRATYRSGIRRAARLDVPVVVVGNLVAGGAGKTPTTMAIVRLLRDRGRHPGVVSRGWGRRRHAVAPVGVDSTAADVGDEPLLIQRRLGVPVVVGRDRVAAARRLHRDHPDVDVIVCDDGLQHLRLARDVDVVVIDGRVVGNGRLLPAGPLRQPVPAQVPPRWLVVHNAPSPALPWPGVIAQRRLAGAVALADWWRGAAPDPAALDAQRGRRVLAAAGLAEPQRFFEMLGAAGLDVQSLPLPDHEPFDVLPWAPETTDVLVTEKDAVKLAPGRTGSTRVWVVALDFLLDASFGDEIVRRLAGCTAPSLKRSEPWITD
ncbi:MAG: tetraacyldisaccharide 4'-kinase [Burkholderiales bacterium]|nr:MAG: tetraacyldisaccharide 4'-kinase [Burkholderiales bacterium]